MPAEPAALRHLRAGIDGVDDALVATLALRRVLVARIARLKRRHALAAADPAREQAVRERARRLGARLGVPAATVDAVLEAAIADARRAQGLAADLGQGAPPASGRTIPPAMQAQPASAARWLRLVPPPARLAPFLRRLPQPLQRRLLERAVASVLAYVYSLKRGETPPAPMVDVPAALRFDADGRLSVNPAANAPLSDR